MIKKFFGGKGGKAKEEESKEVSIEDLITLERYDEAADKLRQRLKYAPKDLYAHLKLAEVYVSLREVGKALDEYTYVADTYAADGFFDKGIALLSRAARLVPGDDMLPRRIEQYKRMKVLEHRRGLAIEGLQLNQSTGKTAGNSALEVELLWNKIAKSHLVDQLDGEQLKKLFSVMEMARTQRGDVLAESGSQLPMIYLIVDGIVDANTELDQKSINLRSFSTGDLIGEGALLEHKAWPAKYTVEKPGTIFKLNREGLEKTLVGNPDPLAFLGVLRQQHHDRDVAASVQKLRRMG